MPSAEVYASRDEVGKTLIKNLRDYGNLEAPGSWGRPYNAGTKTGYCFSCANYLRMAAATRERMHRDMRWYSVEKLEAVNFRVKEGAEPVELELWHATDSGQGYDGDVRQFYNAEDIEGLDLEPEIREGGREDDLQYAFGFLKSSGADTKEVVPTNEALFDAMYDHARSKGLNNFGSKMAAHLFAKTCRLDYDYQNHPLFTDEELHRLSSNPKILFYSMKQANTLLREMEQEMKREIRHSRKDAVKRGEGLRTPFEDLDVTFYHSTLPLKDFSGNAYQEGEHLEGEKAYEFLVQLNAADKNAYDRIQNGEAIKDLTEIHFRYGGYDHGIVPLRLGTLELRNRETVREAIFGKLRSFRRELLANEDMRKGFLQVQYQFMGMPEEKFLEICREREKACERAENRMGWEEEKYLKEHEPVREVNRRKAEVYRYICRGDEIASGFVEFPKPFVLSVQEVTEDMEFYADHLDYREASLPELREKVPFGKQCYLVESGKSPEELLGEGYGEHLKVAFTRGENKALSDLRELELRMENLGTVEHPFDSPVVEEYFGAAAVEHFLREKKRDAELTHEWGTPGNFHRGDVKEMIFSYRGEAFSRISYELGSGSLVEQCPRGMPVHPGKQENEEIQKAVFQQLRYQGERQCSIHDLMQEPEVFRPDGETLRVAEEQEGIKVWQRPGPRAPKEECYAYYANLALRDRANDTQEKFQRAMVDVMKADGLGSRRMANVASCNPKFDQAMITGRTPKARTPARGVGNKAVIQTVPKERGQNRERQRERA